MEDLPFQLDIYEAIVVAELMKAGVEEGYALAVAMRLRALRSESEDPEVTGDAS